MEQRFIVYIDILGFEELPDEISGNRGVSSEKVRNDFLKTIRSKIADLKNKTNIKTEELSDGWILLSKSTEDVLFEISEILDHKTGYLGDYERVPLEIAIGVDEFDVTSIDTASLICNDKIIKFLKSYITNSFRKWYEHNFGERIKESYIILNNSAFKLFDSHYKKDCESIEINGNKIYRLPLSSVYRESLISDFLQKLGQSKNDFCGYLIDKVYIPPKEYKEIENNLKTQKILILTGPPGCGKTYTTIKLLWEYFQKDYKVKWISGKEEQERKKVRDIMANIDSIIKPKHVIYFEDPFGKTTYERREDLKERMNLLIDVVNAKKEAHVIISSRKDVFKSFEEECYSEGFLKKLEVELDFKKPSYSLDKKKKILEKWAIEKDCIWFNNEELKEFVFEKQKDESILPTPFSIYNFVASSRFSKNRAELEKKIFLYSEEAEKAFADEIIGLYEDKREDRVLILLFVFISEFFDLREVKENYENLKKDSFNDFEIILKEEHRIKIQSSSWEEDEKKLKFSHPSFNNAVKNTLKNNGISKLFSNIVNVLWKKQLEDVANAIMKNFDVVPKNLIENLLESAGEEKSTEEVARALMFNFEKLPRDIREKFILRLSSIENPCEVVGRLIIWNFNELSSEIQELLFSFTEKKDFLVYEMGKEIAKNFKKLPKEYQALIFKLAKNFYAKTGIATGIIENYKNLPENVKDLFFDLVEDGLVAGSVVDSIIYNYSELPPKIQDLIPELIKKSKVSYNVYFLGGTIVRSYKRLPEKGKKLLFRLVKDDLVGPEMAWEITGSFAEQPEEVQELLFVLAEKKYLAEEVINAIVSRYEELPEKYRLILFKLSKEDFTAAYIIKAVIASYENMPAEVRDLICKLKDKIVDYQVNSIVDIIIDKFEKLPPKIRKIIFDLAQKKETASDIAIAIMSKFDDCPQKVQNLLFDLIKHKHICISIAENMIYNYPFLPIDIRNKILLEIMQECKDEESLNYILERHGDLLPEKLKILLSDTIS